MRIELRRTFYVLYLAAIFTMVSIFFFLAFKALNYLGLSWGNWNGWQ